MIVDVRTYTLIPRKTPAYLAAFETYGLPIMHKYGIQLLGYYTSQIGALNQVVHIWRYESLADLENKRTVRDADPAWADFLTRTEGMVLMQDNKIMKPATFSPPQ